MVSPFVLLFFSQTSFCITYHTISTSLIHKTLSIYADSPQTYFRLMDYETKQTMQGGREEQPSIGSRSSRARNPTEELHDHKEGYESLAGMGRRRRRQRRQGGLMRKGGHLSPDLFHTVGQFPNPPHPLILHVKSNFSCLFRFFLATFFNAEFCFCPKCQNQQPKTASPLSLSK